MAIGPLYRPLLDLARDARVDVEATSDVVHLQFPFWLSLAALEEARDLGIPVVAAFHVQPENALLNVGIHAQWVSDAVYRWMIKSLCWIVPENFVNRPRTFETSMCRTEN